jgi:hypothetical protein
VTSRLSVVAGAGKNRVVVGNIAPQEGMLTSAGVIGRMTAKTLYFADGTRRRNTGGVTVRHSEAMKYGYPHAEGCRRYIARTIRRNGEYVGA